MAGLAALKYANALFACAPDNTYEEAQRLLEAFEGARAFDSEDIFNMSDVMLGFIGVVRKNGRISELPAILREYVRLVKKRSGVMCLKVAAADTLTPSHADKIKEIFEGRAAKTAEIDFFSDSSLIGGVRISAEGYTFDGSVKKRIEAMRDALLIGGAQNWN